MSNDYPVEQNRTAWQEAEAEGMDMSLIESNLGRTVSERMLVHDRALSFALEIRQAMERRQSNGSA